MGSELFGTEPSADLREVASALWQAYVAFTSQGFTPEQAMQLVTALLTANAPGARGDS